LIFAHAISDSYVRFFDQYPQTAARQYQFVLATSVLSERHISVAGRLLPKLQSKLNPERVDTLVFLYENLERWAVDCSLLTEPVF